PLRELSLVTDGERLQLQEWNRTSRDYPLQRCVHELIEEQAERSPAAVAVVCGEQRLTYMELNRRANRLAHYLLGRGVGREARVGVCLERSVELAVSLL